MSRDASNTTDMLTKVKINKMNSNWSTEALLFKETDDKIFVYTNERLTVIFHFPKHLYTYEVMEDCCMDRKKRIVFDDTDTRHARLRVQLERDGLTQAEFFRAYISAYLDKNENIMTFITDYKLHNNKGQKRSIKIIQKEEQVREQLMSKFGIGDEELEDIFDLIAEEHPDL